MEVDQIQCKFSKTSNGGGYASTIVSQREKMDDDEEEGEKRGSNSNNGGSGGAADPGGGVGGPYGWPSSRIVRVSRATGGKDRHSKVLTSKGLRDRRVRLSVNTAIQFYDLQDRLGYDQPSKAVEWLLAAAADSIAELPSMNSPFPFTNKLPIEERKMSAVASGADHHRMITLDSVMDGGSGGVLQREAAAAAGSSSSETSKGSGLSISRSESRFRARERAKERALEKERENDESSYVASFTELLSGGGISSINGGGGGGGGVAVDKDVSVCRDQTPINNGNSDHQSTFFNKFPVNYFNNGISVPPAALQFSAAVDHQPELQPSFSFASDNLVSANSSAISRGTLQSNSSSSSLQFPPNIFTSAAAPAGNYRHFFPGFDGRLQLYYGDSHGNDGRHSDPKRKDKP